MNKVKVSIILPSLNVIEYFKECIESVLCQTLKEIEIICVDACSTDGTLEMIKEYAKKDNRIKIIISEEKSYGRQVNLAIKASSGKYIGIVETDDFVPPNMYEELYAIAEKNDVDFVKADFYRFTGRDSERIVKALQRVAITPENYNKIINVSDQLETFDFLMNTWSGIYNRDFLMKYNILHNETKGASYQDNGFWFQTLIHANRAYFYDKAYYMNRRDNVNSSVFSKAKVYCICDEYQFILDILRKNSQLFETYKKVYVKICYENYKRNFERIDKMYKSDFLKRFSNDFSYFEKLGMIDRMYLGEQVWNEISTIIKAPNSYYEEVLSERKKTYEEMNRYEQIVIYGAGMIGKRVLEEFRERYPDRSNICFAVTSKQDNLEEYSGVGIFEINSLNVDKDKVGVVIATTVKYQNEIRNILEKKQFKHIILAEDEL